MMSLPYGEQKALMDAMKGPTAPEEVATISSFSNDSASVIASSPNDEETWSPKLPPLPRPSPGKPPSGEKSIQKDRPLTRPPSSFHTHGVTVHYDDEFFSYVDVQDLLRKSSLMSILAWNQSKNTAESYEGQMSIVAESAFPHRQYFMTCQHNVRGGENEDGEELAVMGVDQVVPGKAMARIMFPDQGGRAYTGPGVPLRDGQVWRSGPELCRGPAADPQALYHRPANLTLRLNMAATQVVDANFQYLEGTKVAIAAFTLNPRKLDDMPKTPDLCWTKVAKAKLQACFPFFFGAPKMGPKFEFIITTGKITRDSTNGEVHIEHNVNTEPGHSGALVIVWDPESPYHRQAIALHVGWKEELGANIAFKLQGMNLQP